MSNSLLLQKVNRILDVKSLRSYSNVNRVVGFWGWPRTTIKKFRKISFCKKIFKLIKISEYSHISRTNSWSKKFHSPKIDKKESYQATKKLFFMCWIIAQLASGFVSQKNSCNVHDDTDAFFLFLLQKDFDIFLGPFFVFFLFLRFWYLSRAFFGAFLCNSDHSYLSFLYIEIKM